MTPLEGPGAPCPRCGGVNAALSNQPGQLPAGTILAGKYFIGCALGQGGFGITYMGWDLILQVRLAVKEFFPAGYANRDGVSQTAVIPVTGDKGGAFLQGREKFVQEARTLARFSSDPGVVSVKGFFTENGTAYIVMEYVEGETLKSLCQRRGGRLPVSQVLSCLYPVMDSLARVHDAGLLHRDISPDNIMLDSDGKAVLLDFGAARQISAYGEHSNTINVKHGYAPEEQYRTRGSQGPWTDVYAMCATIYKLITGITPPQAMDRLLSGAVLPPPTSVGVELAPPLEAVILKGLSSEAAHRQLTMSQLKNELLAASAATGQTPAKARVPSAGPRKGMAYTPQLPLEQAGAAASAQGRQPGPSSGARNKTPTAYIPTVEEVRKKAFRTVLILSGAVIIPLLIVMLLLFAPTNASKPASAPVASSAPTSLPGPEETLLQEGDQTRVLFLSCGETDQGDYGIRLRAENNRSQPVYYHVSMVFLNDMVFAVQDGTPLQIPAQSSKNMTFSVDGALLKTAGIEEVGTIGLKAAMGAGEYSSEFMDGIGYAQTGNAPVNAPNALPLETVLMDRDGVRVSVKVDDELMAGLLRRYMYVCVENNTSQEVNASLSAQDMTFLDAAGQSCQPSTVSGGHNVPPGKATCYCFQTLMLDAAAVERIDFRVRARNVSDNKLLWESGMFTYLAKEGTVTGW